MVHTVIRPSTLIALSAAAALSAVLPAAAQQEPVAAQPAPAAQANPAATTPPAAPAAPAAEAAAPVEQAEAPPPPPVLPTTGDGAVVTTLLSRICEPLVKGGDLDALAKQAGLVKDRKLKKYVVGLSQRPYQIVLEPQGANNTNVCELRVQYAPGWDQPILESLNIWSFLHAPQLFTQRNDIGRTAAAERTTTTWDNRENELHDGKRVGVLFSKVKRLDPKSANANANVSEAIIRYSIRAPEGAG